MKHQVPNSGYVTSICINCKWKKWVAWIAKCDIKEVENNIDFTFNFLHTRFPFKSAILCCATQNGGLPPETPPS